VSMYSWRRILKNCIEFEIRKERPGLCITALPLLVLVGS
jgi:hypothetical protein